MVMQFHQRVDVAEAIIRDKKLPKTTFDIEKFIDFAHTQLHGNFDSVIETAVNNGYAKDLVTTLFKKDLLKSPVGPLMGKRLFTDLELTKLNIPADYNAISIGPYVEGIAIVKVSSTWGKNSFFMNQSKHKFIIKDSNGKNPDNDSDSHFVSASNFSGGIAKVKIRVHSYFIQKNDDQSGTIISYPRDNNETDTSHSINT